MKVIFILVQGIQKEINDVDGVIFNQGTGMWEVSYANETKKYLVASERVEEITVTGIKKPPVVDESVKVV